MSQFHLAEINIGRLRATIDDPMIADFKNNLDRINALAEGHAGFVWRLTGDGNDATDLVAFDDPLIITNMSVWRTPDDLGAYVYRSGHVEIMRRRREWFEKLELSMALWWVPAGHRSSVAEGVARLATLRSLGPTAEAFTFRDIFPAPDSAERPLPFLDECA
ncbi:DUF3291 domain-containing protein [Phenylobacterium sp.]|uniref:DUF3291 domain-containing protein n=1 Tax=Phenylobacterium sp. TaxID=1871053 RepID=UPI00286CC784|nr:DUF3291 domain-containing protein [Phenylobacterium sp.]